MENDYKLYGYHITTDPNFQNEKFGNTPELIKQFVFLQNEAGDKKNKKIIDKLIKLIIENPKSPQLKNFLSVAYYNQGKYDKAVEVNKWILAEHHDYVIGIVNEAHACINRGELSKVPQILGEGMEIKELFPERDLFHLSEVTAFFRVVIRYYTTIGNLELAQNRFEILEKIAPGHPDTVASCENIFDLGRALSLKRWDEEKKQRITPKPCKPLPLSQKTKAPAFNHPEIEYLYNFGLRIPHRLLSKIIALPRETLIEDLEIMLTDAVDRYRYFRRIKWHEDTHNFVLHAIFILKEIKADASLSNILSFLENKYELLNLWLGDHKTETLWQAMYGLGFNNTGLLWQFLLKPGLDTFAKTVVSDALCQMVLHHPEKRSEVLNIFSDVFYTFLNAGKEDNLIDSEFLALAIGDCIDCRLPELLPVIKNLYDKKYVSISVNGDYSDVEEFFAEPERRNRKRNVYPMIDLYENVLNTWSGYMEDEEVFDSFPDNPEPPVLHKTGRNDLCPCGSGKKFKKCCIDKI